jgi:type I restriction enzyme S subunit
VKIGDIASFQNGYAFKSKNFILNGNYKIIKIKELKDGKVKFFDDSASIDVDNLKDYEKYIVKKGDILFALTGDPVSKNNPLSWVGRVSVYEDNTPALLNQRVCKLISSDNVNSKYIYYYFRDFKNFYALASIAKGSASQANISSKDIENVDISLPSLEVQNCIVEILDCVSNKININIEINNNLEQQMQIIFSEWLATHIADSTEVSLGEICVKVTDGSHFSPKDEPKSNIPMLSVKDMGKFDFNISSCKHISENDYQKMVDNDCVPQVNDILVAKDGSYLKEIFICNEQRRLAILSSIAIFRPDDSKIYPEILLAFLKSPRVLQEVKDNYVSGSALPRIVLKDFKKLRFLLPDMVAQSEISSLLSSIRSQIAVNEAESQRLNLLQDNLLPKLMCGELDVSNLDL